ncbi:MAG: translation elongation factor Ts [Candidatus Babeliales bacterium]
MAKIDPALLSQLRERTGLGMMDCRKALEEANGNIELAIELLRKRGAALAVKRAGKETAEGVVHAYIHPGSRIGVLIEVNCETDFVAKTTEMQKFAQDVCMHIAAIKPLYLNPESVDPKFIEREMDLFKEQMKDSGKPQNIITQIVEGKMKKLYSEICLMQQPFVKNDQLTIDQLMQELSAKTGENIRIKRFARFEIGTY